LREVVVDKHLRVCPLQPEVGSSYEASAQFPMNLREGLFPRILFALMLTWFLPRRDPGCLTGHQISGWHNGVEADEERVEVMIAACAGRPPRRELAPVAHLNDLGADGFRLHHRTDRNNRSDRKAVQHVFAQVSLVCSITDRLDQLETRPAGSTASADAALSRSCPPS
jgi:hypothetical protein